MYIYIHTYPNKCNSRQQKRKRLKSTSHTQIVTRNGTGFHHTHSDQEWETVWWISSEKSVNNCAFSSVPLLIPLHRQTSSVRYVHVPLHLCTSGQRFSEIDSNRKGLAAHTLAYAHLWSINTKFAFTRCLSSCFWLITTKWRVICMRELIWFILSQVRLNGHIHNRYRKGV